MAMCDRSGEVWACFVCLLFLCETCSFCVRHVLMGECVEGFGGVASSAVKGPLWQCVGAGRDHGRFGGDRITALSFSCG